MHAQLYNCGTIIVAQKEGYFLLVTSGAANAIGFKEDFGISLNFGP